MRYGLLAAAAALAIPAAASATASFNFTLAPESVSNSDTARFTLFNTSNAGEIIDSLLITLGDFSYNADVISGIVKTGTLSHTTVVPDSSQNFVRSDTIRFNFAGTGTNAFQQGEAFSFLVELDADGSPAQNIVDYRDAFAGGTVAVTFRGGPILTASIPEPASWAMMLGGFGLVGAALRSRRKPAVQFA